MNGLKMFRKNPLHTNYDLIFYESSEPYGFFNCLHDSNFDFRAGELFQKGFRDHFARENFEVHRLRMPRQSRKDVSMQFLAAKKTTCLIVR